jgi:hypothetical protein
MLEKIKAEDVVVGDMIRSATLTDPDIPLRYEVKPVVRIERTPNPVDGGEFISLYFENGNVLPVSTGRELTVERTVREPIIPNGMDFDSAIAWAADRPGGRPAARHRIEDVARTTMRLDMPVLDMSASMATEQPTARRATVADVLFVLPHGGAHERPRITASEARTLMESRRLTETDDALADAIHHALVGIESLSAPMVWITDAGLAFEDERLRGWDRALCPMAHEYDLFVPGVEVTARTHTPQTLFPAARSNPQSSIFAYHGATDYCKVESDRVNALACTPQDESSDDTERITKYVVVDADGARVRTPWQFKNDLIRNHYGEDDTDPNEVVMVHLRGEYELHRVQFDSEPSHTDDEDYIHHTTIVKVDGAEVGRIHWTVDGRV